MNTCNVYHFCHVATLFFFLVVSNTTSVSQCRKAGAGKVMSVVGRIDGSSLFGGSFPRPGSYCLEDWQIGLGI